ncbi:MAG: VIT1/CCC1 transporter family protein [Actinomycetota bacterium]|nr:VIT1/CCC1 transporter family protein [Actinomycetota bacterium]
MSHEDLKQAIFGSFDGLTSALGVITGLIVAGVHTGPRILAAALGLAVAATVGMGAGEYLSDEGRSPRRALVMAAATLSGSILPALPFALGYGAEQLAGSGTLTIAAALVIGHYRGYRLTLSILTVVAALTIALTVAVG